MATYDEIQEQIRQLQKQAEEIKQAELKSVLDEIKAKIVKYGLTAEQLGLSSAKSAKKNAVRKSVEVKYRNGDLVWSGAPRGRRPAWVVELLKAGEDIEKYRV